MRLEEQLSQRLGQPVVSHTANVAAANWWSATTVSMNSMNSETLWHWPLTVDSPDESVVVRTQI